VVRGLGYAAPPDLGNPGLPELHYELYHPEDRLPPVELHWRVHWLEERFSRDLLARSTPGGEARTAQPTDELVALLLFYSRDGFTGLKLLADIAAWWDRYGDDGFDGKDFAALLGEHPALAPACAAANMVAAPLIGLPTLAQRGDRRTTLAVRLANWNLSGDIDQIKANVTLVDGLLAPKGTIGAFVRRHLLLSRERLEDYYHLPPRAGLRRLVWKVVHPPKTLLRYAVALATLLRRRSWSPGAEMAHS
jgi:hypothetical protein